MNIVQEGVGVQGNQVKFAQYGHLATRLLELLRDGLHGPMEEETQPEVDEDHIVGRYIYVNPPVWGRTKVFYEKSGSGKQEVMFCHTAGSDSRQIPRGHERRANDGEMYNVQCTPLTCQRMAGASRVKIACQATTRTPKTVMLAAFGKSSEFSSSTSPSCAELRWPARCASV